MIRPFQLRPSTSDSPAWHANFARRRKIIAVDGAEDPDWAALQRRERLARAHDADADQEIDDRVTAEGIKEEGLTS